MTKEEIYDWVSRKPKVVAGLIVVLCWVGIIISGFIAIWGSNDLAFKIFLSSFTVWMIVQVIYQGLIDPAMKETADHIHETYPSVASADKKTFEQKLESLKKKKSNAVKNRN